MTLIGILGGTGTMKREPFKGMCGYAITVPGFPVKKFLKQYPKKIKKPALAIFPGTFGWRMKGVQLYLDMHADRKHLLTCYVSNGAGRRRPHGHPTDLLPDLNRYEWQKALLAGDKAVVTAVKAHVLKLKEKLEPLFNENTVFMLCPELEDNLSDEAWKKLAKIIRSVWKVPLFRNPCTGGRAGGKKYEVHGLQPNLGPKNIGNTDGISIHFPGDGEDYVEDAGAERTAAWMAGNTGAFALLLWSATQQGNKKMSSYTATPVPPLERSYEVTDIALHGFQGLLGG